MTNLQRPTFDDAGVVSLGLPDGVLLLESASNDAYYGSSEGAPEAGLLSLIATGGRVPPFEVPIAPAPYEVETETASPPAFPRMSASTVALTVTVVAYSEEGSVLVRTVARVTALMTFQVPAPAPLPATPDELAETDTAPAMANA